MPYMTEQEIKNGLERIKQAKLSGTFDSTGMNPAQGYIHLVEESDKMIRKHGIERFIFAEYLDNTVKEKTARNLFAEIAKWIEWTDVAGNYFNKEETKYGNKGH